ncbi:MAG: hypothetical protein Q2306_01595 [Phytoplasma sp.]|uniref:hypothetical protein n=1 Tax=Phytoplasma sp. TaxID=2155 RepID=UPI002B403B02|nr:hypothetical protein [Phytoplasma sp.]WRH06582.1 MAG: hypothetical protein Q2306_01595 [Phytoplasma sp.]
MKKEITNKIVLFSLIKTFFVLIVALSCWFPDTFQISGVQLYKSLLGFLVFFITYFLIFPNFKKNKNVAKILFFIETCVFILISLILIFHFCMPQEGILLNISNLDNIIFLICIIHSITKLYIETILEDKNNILSFFIFFFYIFILSTSCYLLGFQRQFDQYIRTSLAIIFSIIFIYYIYSSMHSILLLQSKKNRQQYISE